MAKKEKHTKAEKRMDESAKPAPASPAPRKTEPKKEKKEKKEKNKKIREKDQIKLEKQLVKEGKILPRARYAPRGRLRGVLAFCLAFFLGMVAALGSLVGAGLYLGTKTKIKDVFSLFGADSSSLVTEEYAEKTVIDLVGDIAGIKFENLNSIGKFTPVLRNTLGDVFSSFETMGIEVDVDQFMNTDFDKLGTFFQEDVLQKVELGKALGVTASSDPIMVALCYGKEGENFTVNEAGEIVMNEGQLPMRLTDLIDGATDIIGRLDIGTILSVDGASSSLMQAIADWKIDDFTNPHRIDRLKIKQIIDLEGSDSPLMKAIGDWRIGELSQQSKLNSLVLGDVITIDDASPLFLRSLKDTPIGEMSEAIDTLRLSELMGDEALSSNKILSFLKDSTIDTLSEDLSHITVGEVFADEIYSFMKIENGRGYQTIIDEYAAHHDDEEYNREDHRPQALALKASEVTSYRVVAGGARLTRGYYREADGVYTALTAEEAARVRYDAAAAHDNRSHPDDLKPVYYLDTEHRLSPVYTYGLVNYQTGAIDSLPEGDYVADGTYFSGGAGYPVSEDDYSLYYRNAAGERIDLERTVTGYTDENGTYPSDGGTVTVGETSYRVQRGQDGTEAYDFYSVSTPVFERYASETATYDLSETEERFEYTDDNGETVQLDRFTKGVWHLLLVGENGEDRSDTPVLDLDGLVSGVSGSITSTPLWELYLHDILSANPFVKLQFEVTLASGETVTNLNSVTVVQSIEVVQQLNGKLSALPVAP